MRFRLTITFLENVSGFAKGDLTVTGHAKATAVSGGPKVYTATITPNAASEGDVTVRVRLNTVIDAAGNLNTVSATTSAIQIDTIAPTVTITGVPTTEQNGFFLVTLRFSERVSGFHPAFDMAVGGPAVASSWRPGETLITVTLYPLVNSEGDVTLQVKEGTVTDDAGNLNTASDVTSNIHIDTIVPTATISGLPSGAENDAFDLTITFNENVSGFATADLAVSGEATATAVSGSGSNYTATITPNANKDEIVTVQVKAGLCLMMRRILILLRR